MGFFRRRGNLKSFHEFNEATFYHNELQSFNDNNIKLKSLNSYSRFEIPEISFDKHRHDLLSAAYPSIEVREPVREHEHPDFLDADQARSVYFYTGDSTYINRHLIEKQLRSQGIPVEQTTRPSSIPDIESHIDNLTHAIRTAHTQQDMYLHSGIGFDPHALTYRHKGFDYIHLPAFTSTTTVPSKAIVFAKSAFKLSKAEEDNVLMKHVFRNTDDEHRHFISIHVPKGSHALNVSHHTQFSREKEVLLNRNCIIALHKTPLVIEHETSVSKERYKHWLGVLLHDGTNPTRHATE